MCFKTDSQQCYKRFFINFLFSFDGRDFRCVDITAIFLFDKMNFDAKSSSEQIERERERCAGGRKLQLYLLLELWFPHCTMNLL